MRIIKIKMSEEGRVDIITTRVEIADHDYAEAYYMSIRDGFIKFPAFTIVELSIEDEPTLDEILVHAEEAIADAMMDKLSALEDDILHNRTPARFDEVIEDEERLVSHGIVYPENGAPEHDAARSLVQKASAILREPRVGS